MRSRESALNRHVLSINDTTLGDSGRLCSQFKSSSSCDSRRMCTQGLGSLLSCSLHNPPHLNLINAAYFYLNCNRSRPFLFFRQEWLETKWDKGADGILPSDPERKVSYEHFIIVTSLSWARNGDAWERFLCDLSEGLTTDRTDLNSAWTTDSWQQLYSC